jgi:predicted phage terminase large subunit-like protein
MIYGVGWGITGKGGNRLIIDDPYATRQDAESDTIRKRVEDWYDSTFLSRRHNSEAWICLIMQRWREDDLVGYILEKEKDWEIVKIPAISDEWESFWDSRFPVPYLEEMRTVIGSYFFESQYQQEPFIDWWWSFKREYFMEYDNHPPIDTLKVYTFVDPAISQKQEADYTAIVTIGIDQNNRIYVLDIFHERVEPSDSINALFEIVKQWRPERVGVEVVAFQKMLALEIKKQMTIRNTFFNLDEINPMGEKNARIRTILEPRYSNANILHPKYNKNTKDLELELLKFPNWKHDDIIDSLSGAVRMAEIESYWDNDYIRTHSYSSLFK